MGAEEGAPREEDSGTREVVVGSRWVQGLVERKMMHEQIVAPRMHGKSLHQIVFEVQLIADRFASVCCQICDIYAHTVYTQQR